MTANLRASMPCCQLRRVLVALAAVCLHTGRAEGQRENAVSRVVGEPNQHELATGDSAVSRLVLQSTRGTQLDPARRRDLRAISDDPEVARVAVRDGRLLVYALRDGQARVKITVGQVTGWVLVTVQARAQTAAAPAPPAAGSAPKPPDPPPMVPAEPPPVVSAIRAGDSLVTMLPGEATRLNVIPLGPGGAPVRAALRFTSFNVDAADVDSLTGDVVARAPGRAMIGVEASGTVVRTTIEVRVTEADLRIAPDTVYITSARYDTLQLVAPGQGGRPYRGRVQWSSLADSVAQVDSSTGEVLAGVPGIAGVSARAAGREVTAVVRVYPRPFWIQAPAYRDSVVTVALGSSRAMVLAALGEQKDTLYALPARWSFADSGIAAYDDNRGLLHGRRVGTTRLTARPLLRGAKADTMSWTIRVVGGAIGAGPVRRGYRVGDRDSLQAVLLDSLGAPTEDRVEAVWESGQASVLRPVGPGQFEALAPGQTTLTGRSTWDSIATITAFVAPDLVFPVGGTGPTGRRFASIHGYDFRNRAARALTGTTGIDADPAVSPDRTRLAFTRVGDRGQEDLWVVDIGGGNEISLTTDTLRESRPLWSRDGTRLFYLTQKGKLPRVYSVEFPGGTIRPVTDSLRSVQDFALAPDGRQLVLAVVRGEAVDLLASELTAEGMMASAPLPLFAAKGMDQSRPRFAARSGELFFVRRARTGKREPILMRYRPGAGGPPEALFRLPDNVLDFAVSPDGDRLVALTGSKDPKSKEPKKGLYEIDQRTGAVTALLYEDAVGDAGRPAFTP